MACGRCVSQNKAPVKEPPPSTTGARGNGPAGALVWRVRGSPDLSSAASSSSPRNRSTVGTSARMSRGRPASSSGHQQPDRPSRARLDRLKVTRPALHCRATTHDVTSSTVYCLTELIAALRWLLNQSSSLSSSVIRLIINNSVLHAF